MGCTRSRADSCRWHRLGDDDDDGNDGNDDNDDDKSSSSLPHCNTDVAPAVSVVNPAGHWMKVLPLM